MPGAILLDAVAAVLGDLARQPGIVAVSGGPDSVALLRCLALLRENALVGALIVAHLNHQLRGDDSAADARFVEELAARFGLPFRGQRIDVRTEALAHRRNLEDCARRLRYDWLTRLAGAERAAWVATGHTMDDQAETVLFRLMRGSGLHGLAGMASRRPLAPGVTLVRPLLHFRREDLLAFLKEIGQDYREDASNLDVGFRRNRIRRDLLPALAAEYNPALVSILCRLATQAREAGDAIRPLAEQLLHEAELSRAGPLIVLSAEALSRPSRHVAREALRLVWQRECWPSGEMTFNDWNILIELAGAASGAHDFPGGVRAKRSGRVLQLGPREK